MYVADTFFIVGEDAKTTYTTEKLAMTRFRVVHNDRPKRDGTDSMPWWIEVTMFGKQGENVGPYLKKGTQVVLFGEMTLDPYTRKDGTAGLGYALNAQQVRLLQKTGTTPSEDHAPAPRPAAAPARPAASSLPNVDDAF